MKPNDSTVIHTDSWNKFAEINGLSFNQEQADKVWHAVTELRQNSNDLAPPGYGESKLLIAGGAISRIFRVNSTVGGDIDVYGLYTRRMAQRLRRSAADTRVGPCTITVKGERNTYNFIYSQVCGFPDIILYTFDFNMVRLAVDIETAAIHYVPAALTDLRTGILTLSGTEWQKRCAAKSLETYAARIAKYASMGYSLSFDSVLDDLPLASVGDTPAKLPESMLPEGLSPEEIEDMMYAALPELGVYTSNLRDRRIRERMNTPTAYTVAPSLRLGEARSYSMYVITPPNAPESAYLNVPTPMYRLGDYVSEVTRR